MSLQLCINISGTSAHFAEVLRSTSAVEREEILKCIDIIDKITKRPFKKAP